MEYTDFKNRFYKKYPHYKDYPIDAFMFGDDANLLLKLVIEGKKQGTSSLHTLYEKENLELPRVNTLSIVTNANDEPKAVIMIEKVECIPFNKITPAHAEREGEGDLSLEFWKKVHKKFFEMELSEHEETFNENMLVVYETFKCIYYE